MEETVTAHRVTVIAAPSGFGKTTAVRAWAAGRPGRVAWLSLSAFDSDTMRLGSGIVHALQTLVRSEGLAEVIDLLALDPETRDSAEVYRALCGVVDTLDEPLVLVIDDAQRAAEGLTEGLLGALLDSAPESLRILLVGTAYLELAMSRHLLMNPGASIGARPLAFDEAEVSSLVSGERGPDAVQALLATTQGWPIAVRLIMLGGAAPADREEWRGGALLRDYVRDHVLDSLPPDLAQFAMATTVCTELTPELAGQLTGRADAGPLLEDCARLGLFLDRYDTGAGVAYRWHGVFARQCRAVLEGSDPERLVALHRAAAQHLAAVDPLAAVAHWLRAGDTEQAVQTILERWVGLVVGSEALALDRLCAGLPEPHRLDPCVLLVRACAQDVIGDHRVAGLLFAQAQQVAASTASLRPEYAATRALARIFVLDDRAAVTEASAEVREELARDTPLMMHNRASILYLLGFTELRHRHTPGLVLEFLAAAVREAEAAGDTSLARRASENLAISQGWAGRFSEARQTLARLSGVEESDSPWVYYAGGGAGSAAGFIRYWENNLPAAELEFTRVISGGSGRLSFAGVARMMLALTAAASGDPKACQRAAAEAHAIPSVEVKGISWPAFRQTAFAALEEAVGRRDRAVAIARRYAETDDLPLVSVVLAGILRRAGDPVAALEMLRRMQRYSEVSYVRVATLATAAVVQRRRGAVEAAHGLCERALEVAQPEGIRRPFCDDDEDMRGLLDAHIAWGTRYEDFVADCLSPTSHTDLLGLLSERERVVLGQLRTSKTALEIAQGLGVSINTVKTHQRAIYRKLGVASRREAIRLFT